MDFHLFIFSSFFIFFIFFIFSSFFIFFISGTLLEAFFLDCQALLQNDGAYACAQGKAPWVLLEQTWLALAL